MNTRPTPSVVADEELVEVEPLTDSEAEAAFIALVEMLDRLGCAPAATVASKEDEGLSFSLHFGADRARKLVAAASDRDVLVGRIGELEKLLGEAREALALGAAVPPIDHKNRLAVVSLGESIGYGALMATASVEWRSRLGDLVGAEFCAGPCRSTAESVIAKIDAALYLR